MKAVIIANCPPGGGSRATCCRPGDHIVRPSPRIVQFWWNRQLRTAASRRSERRSVPRLVHQRVLADPGHHSAEFLADLLDRVFGQPPAGSLEAGLVDLVLQHPVAREA